MKFSQLFYLAACVLPFLQCGTAKVPAGAGAGAGVPDVMVATAATPQVANALPFTVTFLEQTFAQPLPRVQSYAHAVTQSGQIFLLGGRFQGLHTFNSSGSNFPADSSNHYLMVIDPRTGALATFDVNLLPDKLSAPLQASNQQGFYDRASGRYYLAGGYGWKADKSDMVTFNTMISFDLELVVTAILANQPVATTQGLFTVGTDDRFAVTGGELIKMGGRFYLCGGQKFMGQYRPFGGSDFTQEYTNQVGVFTLNPTDLSILSYGTISSSDADMPFHRRDGNIIEDIDPATGKERISFFGGVFKPGIIGAYTYPMYVSGPGSPEIVKSVNQKFSQYECPIVSIYDDVSATGTTYHTFFGGVSHYYYWQTVSQKAAYDTVTAQKRNDGLPFISDITTFLQKADGTYEEWIHAAPISGFQLLGTSTPFITLPANSDSGASFANGVIKYSQLPTDGSPKLYGYIYGGIEAAEPLPLIPNHGTSSSNALFSVYVSRAPSSAIPASAAIESIKNGGHE